MKTIDNKTYTLGEAYEVLKNNAEKFDWSINGELPSEPSHFDSKSQRKKYNKAIKRACKRGSRRTFNSLFYIISCITKGDKIRVSLGAKELEIQSKRKIWKKIQADADKALIAYKEEKSNFYKNILK